MSRSRVVGEGIKGFCCFRGRKQRTAGTGSHCAEPRVRAGMSGLTVSAPRGSVYGVRPAGVWVALLSWLMRQQLPARYYGGVETCVPDSPRRQEWHNMRCSRVTERALHKSD